MNEDLVIYETKQQLLLPCIKADPSNVNSPISASSSLSNVAANMQTEQCRPGSGGAHEASALDKTKQIKNPPSTKQTPPPTK